MSAGTFTPADREGLILGSVLADPDNIHHAIKILDGAEFSDQNHRAIFKAMIGLSKSRKNIDPWSIQSELEKGNSNVGGDYGFTLCGALLEACPFTSGMVENHAEYLRDQYVKRTLSHKLTSIAESCKNGHELTDIRQEIIDAVSHAQDHTNKTEKKIQDFRESLEKRIFDRWGAHKLDLPASGITSAIKTYDDLTGGLHRRELLVVGGRPGIGKTMIMTHMALGTARAGNKTGLWSLEMDAESLTERLIANLQNLHSELLRTGDFRDMFHQNDYKGKIQGGCDKLSELPIFIYDQNGPVDEITSSMYLAAKKHGIEVFFVDYLQRIYPSTGGKNLPRHEQVEQAARRFKEFAKETDTAIVLFSQLNRGTELNVDRRPELSNLRDSGGIEQEADVVILLHRNKNKDSGLTMELDIAKSRHGRTAMIPLTFVPEHARFEE